MACKVKKSNKKIAEIMTEHQIYSFIYIFLTWFFTFVESKRLKRMPDVVLLKRKHYSEATVILMIFLIFLMGFRPIGVGGDTGSYSLKYNQMMGGLYNLNEVMSDWLFIRFEYACAQMMPVSMFFLVVAFLYVFLVYWACKRFLLNNATILLLFAMGAFSFFSYGVNGIRNGLAISFVVLALSYIDGKIKDKLLCVLFCFIAINSHMSTVLPIAAMAFAYLIKQPKLMFYIWGGALLGSILLGQSLSNLFALLGFDQRMSLYMTLDEAGETEDAVAAARFRWDFLLYSFMPILLGWYCVFRKRICDLKYYLLLGTYIYANAVWVILIRIPFSNRFAYLSWFLYAIVLAYPLLKFHIWKNQGRKVALIMMAHVSFTFLMYFYTGL